jgi:hypothetical protein
MSIGKTTDLNLVDTPQIVDKAVTAAKIDPEAAAADTVLTSDGAGNATFQPVQAGFNPMFLTGV